MAASAWLYVVYQQTEVLLPGVASLIAFAVGSFFLASQVERLKPYRRTFFLLIVGASASLAAVTSELSSDIANSGYAAAMSFLSVRLSAVALWLAGVNAKVSGDVLYFPSGRALAVGPLCSGAYSSLLFVLLSCVMVADIGRTAPRRKLLVALLMGFAGANLANVFRITFLASVMYFLGVGALDVAHQFAGYAVFLGFMAFFWVLTLRWVRAGTAL